MKSFCQIKTISGEFINIDSSYIVSYHLMSPTYVYMQIRLVDGTQYICDPRERENEFLRSLDNVPAGAI